MSAPQKLNDIKVGINSLGSISERLHDAEGAAHILYEWLAERHDESEEGLARLISERIFWVREKLDELAALDLTVQPKTDA